ncbi:MAG TPA: DNA replication protein [Candidatus Limnocylindria bacterium]|nr:DNA replication protein [Candidatus Limnocylindria bacterium]
MAQLVLDLGHRAALGADDFMVAPSNEAAVAWLDRWPDWPAPALVLHGPPGSGKTHLAQVWRARSGAATAAPTTVEEVPAVLGGARACVVDDADRAPEQPLLHLYNLVAERGGHLLLTASRPPVLWPLGLPDLRSRLLAAPSAALGPPDDALIAAVLLKLFADRQLAVGEEVVAWLLRHMERSFDAARRTVAALDAAALEARRPITVPLAKAVLGYAADGSLPPAEEKR